MNAGRGASDLIRVSQLGVALWVGLMGCDLRGLSARAYADSSLSTELPPASVNPGKWADLRSLFPEALPRIQHGGTCHIYAAAALFESACLRLAGDSVKVSESYQFYRHLRERISKLTRYNLNDQGDSWGSFSRYDGFTSAATLQRIAAGSVASDQELPYDSRFSEALNASFAKVRDAKQRIQAQAQTRYQAYLKSLKPGKKPGRTLEEFVEDARDDVELGLPEQVSSAMDQKLGKALLPDPENDLEGGYSFKTSDAGIRHCLTYSLAPTVMPFTIARGRALLEAKIPFICEGHYRFFSGVEGEHASTVVGYERVGAEPDNVRFIFRDSNGVQPASFVCREMIALDPPAALRAALSVAR